MYIIVPLRTHTRVCNSLKWASKRTNPISRPPTLGGQIAHSDLDVNPLKILYREHAPSANIKIVNLIV